MRHITTSTHLPQYMPYPLFLLDLPLNETEKLVYCLILYRMLMSRSNGWYDQDGRVYCRYTIAQMARDCHKGNTAIVRALAGLEKQGLLLRSRSGSMNANKLYLCLPEKGCADDGENSVALTGKPPDRMPEKRYSVCPKSDIPYARKATTNYKKNYKKNHKRENTDYVYQGDSL